MPLCCEEAHYTPKWVDWIEFWTIFACKECGFEANLEPAWKLVKCNRIHALGYTGPWGTYASSSSQAHGTPAGPSGASIPPPCMWRDRWLSRKQQTGLKGQGVKEKHGFFRLMTCTHTGGVSTVNTHRTRCVSADRKPFTTEWESHRKAWGWVDEVSPKSLFLQGDAYLLCSVNKLHNTRTGLVRLCLT